MQTLQIDKQNAIAAFKVAGKETREVLKALFSPEIFSEKITDQVKSFNDVLEILGEDVTENQKILLAYNGQDGAMISAKAYLQLTLIAKVLNEGWEPNWENRNEYKYTPWFKHKAGFGLSYYDYAAWYSSTRVGSRLCFKTAELAKYAATQFADIYRDYLTIQ